MKKLFANEKIDLLYSIILVLIWIIFLLISKLLHFHSEWVISFIGVFVMGFLNLPTILRRKKQYKKIDELRKVLNPVSYTHLRAHETDSYLVCRLLLEKKKNKSKNHVSYTLLHSSDVNKSQI